MPDEKKAAAKKIIIVKKKKGGHGGHHGGSWKVAYADFVTAMMAFFMVMWILGMSENLRHHIEGYFQNPVGYKDKVSSGSTPLGMNEGSNKQIAPEMKAIIRAAQAKRFQDLAERLRQRLQSLPALSKLGTQIEIHLTQQGLRIELVDAGDEKDFFPTGSAVPRQSAIVALGAIGTELAPQLTNPLIIEGHTDGRAYARGARYTNWELSADRAQAARRILEANRVAPSRVIEVRGLADRVPRVKHDALAPANRRISIILPYVDPGDSDRFTRDLGDSTATPASDGTLTTSHHRAPAHPREPVAAVTHPAPTHGL